MVAVRDAVLRAGGLLQKRQLVALGATDHTLTAAIRAGSVARPRQGWYSTWEPSDPRFRAVRVGGRVTGITALDSWGAWVWNRNAPLHVSVPQGSARQRDQWDRQIRRSPAKHGDVVVHWDHPATAKRGNAWSVCLADALVRVVLDDTFEQAIAAFDWAIRAGQLDQIGLAQVLSALPADARMIGNWIDTRCESVNESITRTWLSLVGFRVSSQIPLIVTNRIDLVVDEHAALEVDGKQHAHTFERDRRKDVEIAISGRHSLRPTTSMIRHEFPRLVGAIEAAIRARNPLWTRGNSATGDGQRSGSRRIWRLLDGSETRIAEFPPERNDDWWR